MDVERTNGGRDFMDEEGEGVTKRADDRTKRLDDHSSALAEKLLQGWTLLNEHCPQCLTPLVRNRQKKMYCAACRQWILTESEAAARLLQQRVDRSDLSAEQNNGNGSPQQQSVHSSTTGSQSASPASATQSPGYQVTNSKGNGIGHLRLSLASLRADEEKAPDNRNPKRFASSTDHVHHQDGSSRHPQPDGKENGNSNGNPRHGVPATREGDHPKPTLVLQPAVNPVNDILVARRTLTTLNEKLEGIRQLISSSHDGNELRQLFAVLEECIHAIQVTRQLLKSVE
ncbi:unnamed protein product [Calypogeia fissa]